MHPRLAELTGYLDEQRAVLAAAVSEVPTGLHTAKPPAGGWSVAEVMEHLVLIERRITGFLKASIDEAKAGALPDESDTSPLLPQIDTASVLDRSRKVVARPTGEPTGAMSVDEASRELDAIRKDMKSVLGSGDGLALGQIVKPHPVLGPINLYEWVAFTAAHMGRHAAQIRETADAVKASQGV